MGPLEMFFDRLTEHIATVIATGVGAYIGNLLRIIHKNKKDLDAVFPKIRRIETALQLKEDTYAGKHICEDGPKVAQRGADHESNGSDSP